MVIRVLLSGVCIIIAAFVYEYMNLIKKRKKALQCWQQLNVQLDRYFGALAPLAKYLKHNGYDGAEIMAHLKSARDINKSKNGINPEHRSEAYAQMQSGIARFAFVIKARNLLINDEAFSALWDSLIKYDEKIRFEATFYNDAARAYNRIVTYFPSSVVASVFAFPAMRLFKISDERENDE